MSFFWECKHFSFLKKRVCLDIETGKTYELHGIFENLKQGQEIRILRLKGVTYIV